MSINFEDKDAYERLKDHLCRNYSKSKWQQGYALLDHPGLGDRRPSQLLQDMRALLPEKEAEGVLFQCLFLKRLPTTMSDTVMAAGLENIEDRAAMADRLHDKPAAASVAALAAQSPCCSHVSAIDSRQRKFNRSGRSPNRSGRSPDRCAATPGPGKDKKDFSSFNAAGRPASQWVKGADKTWCRTTSSTATRRGRAAPAAHTRETRQPLGLGGLAYLTDSLSGTRFLVDTGAAVSVLLYNGTKPTSPAADGPSLAGADGTCIKS